MASERADYVPSAPLAQRMQSQCKFQDLAGKKGGGGTLEDRGKGGVGWRSLAPRTTPGSTKSGIVIGIAGFLTFENWTSPLTGSPSGNSASGAGRSAGCRNQDKQREKRGCEYRSHVVFRQGRTDNDVAVILLYIALRPSAQNPICTQSNPDTGRRGWG